MPLQSLVLIIVTQSWNAYLGRLPDMKLCIEGEPFPHNLSSSPTSHVASAFIDFNVDSERAGQDTDMLIANFTGHDLRSKIKGESLATPTSVSRECEWSCINCLQIAPQARELII